MMYHEVELKYVFLERVSPRAVFALPFVAEGITGKIVKTEMFSTYYDTEDRRLSAAGITLRLRRENEKTWVTVKTPQESCGALSIRGEWQVLTRNIREAIPALVRQGAPDILMTVKENELLKRACVVFDRTEAEIEAGFSAKLAFDEGEFFRGGRSKSFCELELEKTAGGLELFLAFGERLLKALPVKEERRSKLARALLL